MIKLQSKQFIDRLIKYIADVPPPGDSPVPTMKKLLILLISVINYAYSSSSSSSSNEDNLGTWRQRSATEFQLAPPSIVIPATDSPIRKPASASSKTLKPSLSTSFKPKSPNPHRPCSLARYISFHSHSLPSPQPQKSSRNSAQFTSPRISPIISQLNLIDGLLQNHFPVYEHPKTLLPGHLLFLKSHCSQLNANLGPLHPKSRNCAFRFNELKRFLEIVAKYNTAEMDFQPENLQEKFCTTLIPAIMKLNSFVELAYTENGFLIDADSQIYSKLAPLETELSELSSVLENIDFDLVLYCGWIPSSNYSIQIVRGAVDKFIRLAFNI